MHLAKDGQLSVFQLQNGGSPEKILTTYISTHLTLFLTFIINMGINLENNLILC